MFTLKWMSNSLILYLEICFDIIDITKNIVIMKKGLCLIGHRDTSQQACQTPSSIGYFAGRKVNYNFW